MESFKKKILNFIRPRKKNTFIIHNQLGIKLLTCIRVGLTHLKEHKFKNNFQDPIDLLCSCGNSIESTIHYFLHYSIMPLKDKLLNKIRSIDPTFYARNEILLKHSYLEDRILKTNLINKLLTLPSVLHYQQSVLIVLYFQVDLSDSMALQYFLSLIFLFFLFLLLLTCFS